MLTETLNVCELRSIASPMLLTKQAESFRIAAHTAIKARRITITMLAARIGKTREAASRAINRNEFPNVRAAIRKELDLNHG